MLFLRFHSGVLASPVGRTVDLGRFLILILLGELVHSNLASRLLSECVVCLKLSSGIESSMNYQHLLISELLLLFSLFIEAAELSESEVIKRQTIDIFDVFFGRILTLAEQSSLALHQEWDDDDTETGPED